MPLRSRQILLIGFIAAGACLQPIIGQRARSDASLLAAASRDPYTQNDPEKMQAMGYVSFGPFPWDMASNSTSNIAFALGEPRIRWIETAHFKLGCGLAPRKLPERTRHRKMVTNELRALKKKLPGLKTGIRKLDRWLLAHLYAQRLENLYADFAELIGVKDADFLDLDKIEERADYMGEGPYLGQRAKYCVILFDTQTQLLRYLRTFAEYTGTAALPVRNDFTRIGSLGFATASACHGGMLSDEAHMHSHVVSEVVKNLAAGYKSNLIRLPEWWSEGLGSYYARRIDPRIILMDERTDPNQFGKGWDWAGRVRARLKKGNAMSAAELFDAPAFHEWSVHQHMMAWSRVDFLMRRDSSGMRRFLDAFNDLDVPIRDANGPRNRKYQTAAMQKAWGMDLDEFDTQWESFVKSRKQR